MLVRDGTKVSKRLDVGGGWVVTRSRQIQCGVGQQFKVYRLNKSIPSTIGPCVHVRTNCYDVTQKVLSLTNFYCMRMSCINYKFIIFSKPFSSSRLLCAWSECVLGCNETYSFKNSYYSSIRNGFMQKYEYTCNINPCLSCTRAWWTCASHCC